MGYVKATGGELSIFRPYLWRNGGIIMTLADKLKEARKNAELTVCLIKIYATSYRF